MKRILVTGGAGFIGTHLCRRLLDEGHEVLCLDNFFTGRRANVVPLMAYPRFELIRHDIVDSIRLEVDQIYNMACPASPVHYQFDPIKTIQTAVVGTMNLLDLAARTRARFLQASTSEVYGDPLTHPQSESYWGNVNPIGPRACYDEGKRIGETLAVEYHRTRGVDVRIIRIFNTYGPMMLENDGRVVSNLICQALRGNDLTIYGTGDQTRSFCYVSDLVEGIVRMMNHPEFIGPVNLGNPGEFTVRELADKVLAMTGSSSNIVHRPLPENDPQRRRPDITLAKEKLGWEPTVPLDEGLRHTIDYFRREIEGNG